MPPIRAAIDNPTFARIFTINETYLPFIRIAFPYSNNIADGVYNLIMGSALSIFVNQYAMKMKYPTAEDFAEFGKLALKYRSSVDQFFK